MTKHQFGTIGCRLLSLYFLTNAVISFSSPFAMMSMMSPMFTGGRNTAFGSPMILTSLIPLAFQVIASLILWSFAPTIARKMYPVDDPID